MADTLQTLNAIISRATETDFTEGFYHIKFKGFFYSQNSRDAHGQWLAMPIDGTGTRRHFYWGVRCPDPDFVLSSMRDGADNAINAVTWHMDHSLERMRIALSAAHIGELISDRTLGDVKRQVSDNMLGRNPMEISNQTPVIESAVCDVIGG